MKPGHRCIDCELVNRRLQALEEPPSDVSDDDDDLGADKCESCGEPATRTTDDDVDVCDECYAELVRETQAKPPAPKKRGRPFAFKPGTRQPKPAPPRLGATGRNWWETAKPGEMTKTAEQERARMSGSKVAKRVHGNIND